MESYTRFQDLPKDNLEKVYAYELGYTHCSFSDAMTGDDTLPAGVSANYASGCEGDEFRYT